MINKEKCQDVSTTILTIFFTAWMAYLLWNYGVVRQFESLPKINYWFALACLYIPRVIRNILFKNNL